MLRGKVDGVGADDEAERLTHERIRAYAAATPTVYLVAHDPDTGVRLAQRQLVASDRGEGGSVITFQTDVLIGRPLEEVFAYISEPLNLPHWNSAVRTVRSTSAAGGAGAGSTYVMERELPGGRATNGLESSRSRPR